MMVLQLLGQLASYYQYLLDTYPYQANSISAGMVSVIADILRQIVEYQNRRKALVNRMEESSSDDNVTSVVQSESTVQASGRNRFNDKKRLFRSFSTSADRASFLFGFLDYAELLKQYCIGCCILHPISFHFFRNVDTMTGKILLTLLGGAETTGKNAEDAILAINSLHPTKMACLNAILEQIIFSPVCNSALMISNELFKDCSITGSKNEESILAPSPRKTRSKGAAQKASSLHLIGENRPYETTAGFLANQMTKEIQKEEKEQDPSIQSGFAGVIGGWATAVYPEKLFVARPSVEDILPLASQGSKERALGPTTATSTTAATKLETISVPMSLPADGKKNGSGHAKRGEVELSGEYDGNVVSNRNIKIAWTLDRVIRFVLKFIRYQLLQVCVSNVKFWGPVALVNHKFVPEHQRLMFSRGMSVLWMAFLIAKSIKNG